MLLNKKCKGCNRYYKPRELEHMLQLPMPMKSVRRIYQDGVVEYGCPGHGKGPWDGLGAMAKTKVTRDLTDSNVQTPSGRITCALEVARALARNFFHTAVGQNST